MHVSCNFEEVIPDDLYYLLKLTRRSLSEELLTEEVGYLMHHELVEGREFWTKKQVE